MASAGVRPRRAEISISASALAARPRIGSPTRPVKRPSCSSRRLARFSWKPSMAAMRVVKTSKPPETSAVQAPLARMVWTKARPPEANVRRLATMRSTTAASRPFSSATRSRKAGSKAISPFIERAVMVATRSLTPISSASSSMHSWSIMVESMSAMRIFLRRVSACWTITSTGSPAMRGAQGRCRIGGVGLARQDKIAGNPFGQPDNSACADRP